MENTIELSREKKREEGEEREERERERNICAQVLDIPYLDCAMKLKYWPSFSMILQQRNIYIYIYIYKYILIHIYGWHSIVEHNSWELEGK